jgi:hypothetical protein
MKHRLACLSAAVVAIAFGTAITLRPVDGDSTQPAKSVSRGPSKKAKKAKEDPVGDKALKAFMRQKLGAMQQVLRGIVTEDYERIQKNAARMRTMGTAAQWNVVQGPIYGDYRASFRRSAELLSKAAKSKNADAAMLVYMQATLNCIECHRYVREPKQKNRVQ